MYMNVKILNFTWVQSLADCGRARPYRYSVLPAGENACIFHPCSTTSLLSADVRTNENTKSLLLHLNYSLHEWLICGDIKVISILLGQQAGYTKYPCFRCLWDSRADHLHFVQRFWPSRDSFTPGKHNIREIPLVDPDKVLFPPLHIKLGLMKNFVKALDRDGPTLKFLEEMFSTTK